MSQVRAIRFVVVLGAVGLMLGGCAGLSVLGTFLRDTPWVLAGGDGQSLILASKADQSTPSHQRSIGSISTDLHVLDTSTMNARKLVSGITTPVVVTPGWMPQVAADGRYVAWIDAKESDVVLYDSSLDTQSRWDLLGNSDTSGVFIMDGRLLVNRRANRAYELVVLDIGSGSQTVVADSWLYGGFALSGDMLVLRNHKDTDVEILGLELSANVEQVDLASGQRQFIARNIRVPGDDCDGGGLFGVGDRVVWCDYAEGTFDLRIQSHDIVTGQTACIADKVDPEGGLARLCGVAGDVILLEMRTGDPIIGETVWLEALGFDGRFRVVSQLGSTADPTWLYAPRPQCVGGLVVWTAPLSGAIETWNSATETRASFGQTGS